MSTDERPIVTTNLVVGICVTAVGAALVLDQLHVVDARQLFRFWPVAVILFGASMVMEALRGGDDVVDDRPRRRSGPRLFIPILLILIVAQTLQRGRNTVQTDANETTTLFAVMAVDQRTSYATRFHHGEMTSIMGACRLDLRPAMLAPGEEAVIDVFTVMGGLVITVPEGWTVDVQTVPIMGGVNNRRSKTDRAEARAEQESPTNSAVERAPATSGVPPRVVVRGFIMMGGLTIR